MTTLCRLRDVLLLAVLGTCPLAAPAADQAGVAGKGVDYQFHGFAAQGLSLSHGNAAMGKEAGTPSLELYELGLNGTARYKRLTLSAQALARRAGDLDEGKLRLDYGFADLQLVNGSQAVAGVRAGRVKNPYGLFNETRDVVFTRPSILLPSAYFESAGIRNLLFSSDGGQLYGGWSHGNQYTSVTVTVAADSELSDEERRVISGGGPSIDKVDVRDLVVARLMNDWGAGQWTAALSYISGQLVANDLPPGFLGIPVPFDAVLDADIYTLSGRYNAERFSLIAEYALSHSDTTITSQFGSTTSGAWSDSGYIQGTYRFDSRWSGWLRLDANFADRNDRGGDNCSPSSSCYTYDTAIGLSWRPNAHWGVWGEYHHYVGTSTTSALENAGRSLESPWGQLLFMVGYRF